MRSAWLTLALLSLAAPSPASAQYRDLHWRNLNVEARLDSAGTLHVRERQEMVFTGDWNGGERIFNIRLGQRFRFERLLRVDPATGAERALEEGDLSAVDQYSVSRQGTVRWRSRRPDDPLFVQTPFTYILEYTLGNILRPQESSGYLLDHDFAFADRVGVIERFTARLTLDPAWGAPSDFTGSFVADSLYPGRGYVVTVPLRYLRAGEPAGVRLGATSRERQGLAAALLVGLALIAANFLRRERSLGRFAPLLPLSAIDETWLNANVFNELPEVIGASWDDHTAQPEVAAVIARLVIEKKLTTDIKVEKAWIFKNEVLHLKLLVERSELSGYERALIDGLFEPGSDETDTDKVRKRYAKSGFNPARTIEDGLKRLVKAAEGSGDAPPKPSRMPTTLLLVAALALVAYAVSRDTSEVTSAVIGAGVCIAAFIISVLSALAWRSRVHQMGSYALSFLIPLAALVAALGYVLARNPGRSSLWVLAAMTLFVLAIVNCVINSATTRLSSGVIARRKRLAAAREYFRIELQKEAPRLRDEWLPYLLAFGLGGHMDRWFRAFGGKSNTLASSHSGSYRSGSDSYAPSTWSGMGGGGAFAGGGSSGSWASALGVMAAGVSKPSSSSSGGGGGGGGSSGGGGGGGW